MNNNTTSDAAKASARRRLVRGVFAAPAALTLYSGSVAAASVSCLAKQLRNPITSAPTTPDSTLVRVPLYRLVSGSQTAKFVRQADVGALAAPGGSYMDIYSGKVQLISKTGGFGNYPTVGGIYDTPAGLVQTSPLEYVAVRVSNNDSAPGRIEGVLSLPDPGGTSALHTSCWTSFGGLAPFNAEIAPLA